jgi:uncharacterized membrane protein
MNGFDPIAFRLIETFAYATCLVALYFARKRYGWDVVILALASMAYSYVFEALASSTGTYHYDPRFWVKLPFNVPLWIPIGWGTIVFVSTATSNRLGMKWWARPFAAALLALLLDIALDPIAVGLGYWTWKTPGTFYRVTWSNFTGWLLIVGSYSFVVEWLYEKKLTKKRKEDGGEGHGAWEILGPIVAILLALVLCIALHLVLQIGPDWLFHDSDVVRGWIFTLLVLGCVGVCAYSLPRYARHRPAYPELLMVPSIYFAIFIVYSFATSLSRTAPELRVWIPFLGCVVMIGYLWPSIDVLPHAFQKRDSKAWKDAEERALRHARERRDSELPLFPLMARLLPAHEEIERAPSMERGKRST